MLLWLFLFIGSSSLLRRQAMALECWMCSESLRPNCGILELTNTAGLSKVKCNKLCVTFDNALDKNSKYREA